MPMTENKIEQLRWQRGNLATYQQRLAADPKKSVWVSASAGTGKTKVLSDRVLRLLLSGVRASKILCLTYTKAAAVEMNSRVAKRLSEWAIMDDDKLYKELKELYEELPQDEELEKLFAKARQLFAMLLDTPGGIKIQTIHSFCEEILKRFPLEAGVSPYFEIMDDRGSEEAINEVKLRLLNEAGNNPDSEIGEAIGFITENISEYKMPELIKSIIDNRDKINNAVCKAQGKNNLLSAISAKLNINDDDNKQKLIERFFSFRPEEVKELSYWCDEIKPWLNGTADIEKFDDYISLFLTKNGEIRSFKRLKGLAEDDQDIFFDEGERCKNFLQQLRTLRLYQSTKAVLLLASGLLEGYEDFKRRHAKMDYNDMIIKTRALLENREATRWVLYKLDGGIDNILIDEAQDTSPGQWAIIQAISDEFFAEENSSRTVFAVGDRKQSIYSFQGADPDKFDEMCEHFARLSQNFQKINLGISFRSAPAVLTAVNQLFKDKNTNKGVASENEAIEHLPYREGEGGEVELWEMLTPKETESVKEWSIPVATDKKDSTSSQIAKMIAEKIHSMVKNEEILTSKNRPVRYGDFLILVRSRNNFCEELIRECKALNVNIAGIDRIKLMEQIAVKDLISLGKFLILPDDDLSLAEVLKSPLFGLNDEDLFNLCYQRRTTLYKSLQANDKYAHIAKMLEDLLAKIDYMRPFDLYNYILSQMGGRYKFYERMGSEPEDGLDEFLNLSLRFEQEHIPTMQNFIEWVLSDDVEIKREFEQSQHDMVRLMTVHASKGLQAPIVILPDTAKIPKSDREAGFLWDGDLFFYPFAASDYNEYCDKLHERQKSKMLEEYRRLLYVAVTRAEDRMIFCGFRNKKESPDESWYNLFKDSFTKIAEIIPSGDDQYKEKNKWQLKNRQILQPKTKKKKEIVLPYEPMPKFLSLPALKEDPLSKPLTPSKPDDEPALNSPLVACNDEIFYKRGTIIHKLLQFLPDIEAKKRLEVAQHFLLIKAADFSDSQRQEIVNEVLTLIENPEFGSVFGKNSRAEVPIMGEIEGRIISAQIDRMIVEENRVIIVDFKTNRRAATNINEVPKVYRTQLRAYRELLKRIYPHHKIESFILWTNTMNMMKID
ncbi:MAG: double-strand break repair helicase AddA [Alphaproteobacteria bacterium]|nr:double-strand break repair helicase AddA [Alphaproteobacteria bacterium]